MHLEISQLHKEFPTSQGAVLALQDLNLHVNRGEMVCVVGASGSGKSTLLRMIAGLEQPTSGTIEVDGYPVEGPGADRGMIFQNYTLYPWMTVADNVAFGLKLQRHAKADRLQLVDEYLDVVGLADFAHAYPKELSGGMKQRAAIARALICQPKVLLMDEPFGALDVQTKETMQQLLLKIWRQTQTTILMITHDISEAIFLSERVYVLTKLPGTVQREVKIKLPNQRTYKIRHHPDFQAYYEEIYEVIRERQIDI